MTGEAFTPRRIDFGARRKKVLLVEEEVGDRIFLRQTLEGQGFEVVSSATFEAGVESLGMVPFDFVIVSQGSQAFEGRRVLERAAELDRRLPVLVLTRSLDMPCYLEAMQLGAVDYLEKPVTPTDLLRLVHGHTRFDRCKMQAGAA